MICFNEQTENGRSMVEMLGTLAIVGVLSAGAIGGYSYAMNKHRTNELIYEATKQAQWAGTQMEMNRSGTPTVSGGAFGGGTITGVLTNLANNQIGIVVKDLKEAVCDNIKSSIGEHTVILAIKNADGTGDVTCEDNGTAALIFNKDLATTDSTGSGSGSGSGNEDPSEPTQTADPDAEYCSGHGRWHSNSGRCYCDSNWGGEDCSIENACGEHGQWNADLQACICFHNWGGADCSQTARATCANHGVWIADSGTANGGYCDCDTGYGGNDCSIENACGNHGWWYNYYGGYCICDGDNWYWGGNDCSVPNACNGHGKWYGSCYCEDDWTGNNCSQKGGEIYCSNHGIFIIDTSKINGGFCSCNIGYEGSDCSQANRSACSEHGVWIADASRPTEGYCSCDSGYGGNNCSQGFREINCSNHGDWIVDASRPNGGSCSCDSGYGGNNCSQTNRSACSEHGIWIPTTVYEEGGFCFCDTEYTGSDCAQLRASCDNGTWIVDTSRPNGGFCSCDYGYGSSDCSQTNRAACHGNGTWTVDTSKPNGGYCSCDSGYTGADCSTPQ